MVSKRWRSSSAASALLESIFSDQFRNRPEVLTSATRVTGSPPLPQPLWKNRIFEHLDTFQAYIPSFFRNQYISFVALLALRSIVYARYYSPIFDRVYSHTNGTTLFHALPPLINYTPLFALRAVNQVGDIIGYAQSNKISLFFKFWMLRTLFPIPAIRNQLQRISIFNAAFFLLYMSSNTLDIEKNNMKKFTYLALQTFLTSLVDRAKLSFTYIREQTEAKKDHNRKWAYRLFVLSVNNRPLPT
ncbi:MAG: hypothetical protein LVR00_01120 [Rhabdochlamydiaceae bacterium]